MEQNQIVFVIVMFVFFVLCAREIFAFDKFALGGERVVLNDLILGAKDSYFT